MVCATAPVPAGVPGTPRGAGNPGAAVDLVLHCNNACFSRGNTAQGDYGAWGVVNRLFGRMGDAYLHLGRGRRGIGYGQGVCDFVARRIQGADKNLITAG